MKSETVLTVNPSIFKRITELGKPFQRQVYKPLQFILGEETLSGEIEKIDGETVLINLVGEEDLIVSVEMNTIEEILWRGTPFKELLKKKTGRNNPLGLFVFCV